MWFRKKLLIEHDPKTLSLELLSTLQGSLVAKLVLVNDELYRRYQALAQASDGTNSEAHELFTKSAAEIRGFNLVLHQVLAKGLGKS